MRGEKQMNRKEKKAVDLLKALNNLEKKCKIEKVPYKSEIKKIMISLLPEDYGIFEILLNLIKKLQKENEELKKFHIQDNKHLDFIMEHSIPVQKVKDRIEKLKNNPLKIKQNDKYYYETDAYNKIVIQVLQELLEGRK